MEINATTVLGKHVNYYASSTFTTDVVIASHYSDLLDFPPKI